MTDEIFLIADFRYTIGHKIVCFPGYFGFAVVAVVAVAAAYASIVAYVSAVVVVAAVVVIPVVAADYE